MKIVIRALAQCVPSYVYNKLGSLADPNSSRCMCLCICFFYAYAFHIKLPSAGGKFPEFFYDSVTINICPTRQIFRRRCQNAFLVPGLRMFGQWIDRYIRRGPHGGPKPRNSAVWRTAAWIRGTRLLFRITRNAEWELLRWVRKLTHRFLVFKRQLCMSA